MKKAWREGAEAFADTRSIRVPIAVIVLLRVVDVCMCTPRGPQVSSQRSGCSAATPRSGSSAGSRRKESGPPPTSNMGVEMALLQACRAATRGRVRGSARSGFQ